MKSPAVTVLALLALLVSACGSNSETVAAGTDGAEETPAEQASEDTDGEIDDEVSDEGAPVVADVASLPGSSWTLKFGGGPDGDIELVDGWPVTLTFDTESLGGTAACNGYGSGYSTDGQRFVVEGVGSTRMGCAPEVQAAEGAYFAALADVDGINLIDDELALSGPSTELIFTRNVPVAADDLIGTLWLLEAMIQDGESTPVEGDPATLLLKPDGTVVGSTGCRTLSGEYTIYGSEVQFPSFGADGDCPSTLQAQDGKVVGVLGDGFVPKVDGETLTLTSTGNEGLTYRATTEDELSTLEGTPVASDAELLDGVEWVFAGGDSGDGPLLDPRTVGDGSQRITLTFTADGYSGQATCNAYSGSGTVGNGKLSLGPARSTKKGCGDPFNAISAAYSEALPQMTEFGFQADGNELVMNGNEIELLFERADAPS